MEGSAGAVERPEWVIVLVVLTDLLAAALVASAGAGGARRAGLSTATHQRLTVGVAGMLAGRPLAATGVASA